MYEENKKKGRRPDFREILEALNKAIIELKAENTLIIVEGKRDMQALAKLDQMYPEEE